MSIADGRYRARAVQAALGKTSNGKEQVAVEFEILDEDVAGHRITWFGYFTEKTWERTVESLRHCGWENDDLADLSGIDRNEVSIVVEAEEYEGKWNPRVKWVNAPGSGLALKQQLEPHEAKSFAAQMRGRILSLGQGKSRQQTQRQATHRQPEPPPLTDDDIPF